MSDTPISPGAGAATLAGVAPAMNLGIRPLGSTLNFLGASPLMYPVRPAVTVNQNAGLTTFQWLGLINGSSGQPAGACPAPFNYGSASAQISGTFGSGGSIQLEGSMDGINFELLSPGAKTSAALVYLAYGEQPTYIRPRVTAGDSTTLLSVLMNFAQVH